MLVCSVPRCQSHETHLSTWVFLTGTCHLADRMMFRIICGQQLLTGLPSRAYLRRHLLLASISYNFLHLTALLRILTASIGAYYFYVGASLPRSDSLRLLLHRYHWLIFAFHDGYRVLPSHNPHGALERLGMREKLATVRVCLRRGDLRWPGPESDIRPSFKLDL